jgi:hypothetical protein
VRDREGAEIWIVAVRATFSIHPDGTLSLAQEQLEVCKTPQFFADPAASSLRYDSDLVRTKAGTDVILHAEAYSPHGAPAAWVDAEFSVGGYRKQLRVFGDRVWVQHGGDVIPSSPEPFLKVPICYENAWGGLLSDGASRDAENPAGVGKTAVIGSKVPNIESPFFPIRSAREGGSVMGFGPIACHWQPRLKLAGTYDERWSKERRPLAPTDFQDDCFRCAPVDQQFTGFFRGGEEVILKNLTPEGLLRFTLPRVSLGFSTQIEGQTTNHRGEMHTVIIEPSEKRLILTWQTALPCHHTLYTLKRTTVFEKKQRREMVA